MKTRPRKTNVLNIPSSRWLAYAGAGAATALSGASQASAEIHYSGPVNVSFKYNEEKTVEFPLDVTGNFFTFEHYLSFRGQGYVFFGIHGLVDEGIRARDVIEYYLVEKIGAGYVSEGIFVGVSEGTLYAFGRGFWLKRGTHYVGFRFDNGAGVQYGWARVQWLGQNQNFAFKVLDYAYADPGEKIRGGQIRSDADGMVTENSLGVLALGAAGITLWRRRRQRFPEESA